MKYAEEFFTICDRKPIVKKLPESYLSLSNEWLWFLYSLNSLFVSKKIKYKSRENAERLLLLRSIQSLEIANKLLKESYYPESASALRLVFESANLIKLFQIDELYALKWFNLNMRKVSKIFMPSKVRNLTGVTQTETKYYYLLSNIGTHPSRMSISLILNTKRAKRKKDKLMIKQFSKPVYQEQAANLIMFFFLYSSKKLAIQILDLEERREKAKKIIALGSDKNLVVKIRELYKVNQEEIEKLKKKMGTTARTKSKK